MNKKETNENCKVCPKDKINKANTCHHIIPKVFRKKDIVKICQTCHYSINNYFSNYELYKLALKGIYPTTKKFQKLYCDRIKEIEELEKN